MKTLVFTMQLTKYNAYYDTNSETFLNKFDNDLRFETMPKSFINFWILINKMTLLFLLYECTRVVAYEFYPLYRSYGFYCIAAVEREFLRATPRQQMFEDTKIYLKTVNRRKIRVLINSYKYSFYCILCWIPTRTIETGFSLKLITFSGNRIALYACYDTAASPLTVRLCWTERSFLLVFAIFLFSIILFQSDCNSQYI